VINHATDSNTVANTYTWGLDLSGQLQGAGGVGGLLCVTQHQESSTQNPYYVSYDANGNISEYVDESDNVVAHYEYSPFGKLTASGGSKADDFRHRFSTKYQDDETNLYYYGFRYFSSELGRWINRDPIAEAGGLNLQRFIKNNTTNLFDILGREAAIGINVKMGWGLDVHSVNATASVSHRVNDNVSISGHVNARFYDQGPGTPVSGDGWTRDLTAGGSMTYGQGRGEPTPTRTINTRTPINNTFEHSLSKGWYVNNNSAINRTTLVGTFGGKSGSGYFNYYNDSLLPPSFGQGTDRGHSAGFTIGQRDATQNAYRELSWEVFTGTHPPPKKTDPLWINEHNYNRQSPYQQALNRSRWRSRYLEGRYMSDSLWGTSAIAPDSLFGNPQNFVHDFFGDNQPFGPPYRFWFPESMGEMPSQSSGTSPCY